MNLIARLNNTADKALSKLVGQSTARAACNPYWGDLLLPQPGDLPRRPRQVPPLHHVGLLDLLHGIRRLLLTRWGRAVTLRSPPVPAQRLLPRVSSFYSTLTPPTDRQNPLIARRDSPAISTHRRSAGQPSTVHTSSDYA